MVRSMQGEPDAARTSGQYRSTGRRPAAGQPLLPASRQRKRRDVLSDRNCRTFSLISRGGRMRRINDEGFVALSTDDCQLPTTAAPFDQFKLQQSTDVCRLKEINVAEADLSKGRF